MVMAILRGLCTVAQVENNTHPENTYGTTTVPTKLVVEGWIDEDIDLLYPILRAGGIITPVVETEAVRIVAIIQAKRVAARIEDFLHYTTGQIGSSYADALRKEADNALNDLLTKSKLDSTATDGSRVVLPQQSIWSKMKEDIWDSGNEDIIKKEPMFTIDKEF